MGAKVPAGGFLDRVHGITLAMALTTGMVVGYFDHWQAGLAMAAGVFVFVHEVRAERDTRATLVGLLLLLGMLVYGVALVGMKLAGKTSL